MIKQQKTYTREFKVVAVQLVKGSGKPMSQIARELGITATQYKKRRIAELREIYVTKA